MGMHTAAKQAAGAGEKVGHAQGASSGGGDAGDARQVA